MSGNKLMARLAFREEGKWWIAYLAKMDGMAGAVKLGSIRMNVVRGSEKTRAAFMDAMKVAFSETVMAATGEAPTEFETRQAPEHEKAGHS